MKKGIWHKRIPNLAALVLLLGGLWVSLLMLQTGVFFVGQASPNKIPQNVIISNITDKSFTVSFTTNEKTLSALSIREGNSPSYIVYDDRNQQNQARDEYMSHFITIRDLKPNTTYTFSLLSNGEIYQNNGSEYTITTGGPIVGDPPTQNPIIGNVLLADGQAGNDTIIDLKIEGAQTVSVLSDTNGQFTIPTNSIRNSDLDSYYSLSNDEEVIITARYQDTLSTVRARYQENTIIPTITISRNYDFSNTLTSEVATLSSELSVPTPRIGIGEVRITIPTENQSFVDSTPLFRGTGVSRQSVSISIDGQIQEETATDGNGIWTYRPDTSIAAGEHELTIVSNDRFGIAKSVSQAFTIFSSGSQVAQEATPSATPTMTATPTSTPTSIPSLEPSPSTTLSPSPTTTTPSITITPTLITTETPTATPIIIASQTPTLTQMPTPTIVASITPPSPGSESIIILTFISVLLIGAGGALLFLL